MAYTVIEGQPITTYTVESMENTHILDGGLNPTVYYYGLTKNNIVQTITSSNQPELISDVTWCTPNYLFTGSTTNVTAIKFQSFHVTEHTGSERTAKIYVQYNGTRSTSYIEIVLSEPKLVINILYLILDLPNVLTPNTTIQALITDISNKQYLEFPETRTTVSFPTYTLQNVPGGLYEILLSKEPKSVMLYNTLATTGNSLVVLCDYLQTYTTGNNTYYIYYSNTLPKVG